MIESEELIATRAMADCAVVVAQYRETDPIKAVDRMLTELSNIYKNQLADVKPEELVRTQACLKQTLAIRAVFRGDQQLPLI